MTSFAFATAPPLLTRPARPTLSSQRPRCSMQDVPPESRISPNYPPSRRFLAPVINMLVTEIEIVNSIGVVMEPAPLDLELAAEVMRNAVGATIDNMETLTETLFVGKNTNQFAQDASEKYFPMSRRDDAPIIEITAPTAGDDTSGQLNVSIGKVTATPPPEEEDSRPQSFWSEAVDPADPFSARSVVDAAYPPRLRHLAPIIEFPSGALSVQMSMQPVLGECEAELYPKEARFMAPEISMKRPAGDWDTSGFVCVASAEVRLPLLAAASLD